MNRTASDTLCLAAVCAPAFKTNVLPSTADHGTRSEYPLIRGVERACSTIVVSTWATEFACWSTHVPDRPGPKGLEVGLLVEVVLEVAVEVRVLGAAVVPVPGDPPCPGELPAVVSADKGTKVGPRWIAA
jgi:hypothetical protein